MMRVLIGIGCALLAASAAQAEDPPLCTDRPAKANAVCTVPAGKWQVESAAVDWSRVDQDGRENETLLVGSTFLKVGLSSRSDFEAGFIPYVRVRGEGDAVSGVGDLTLRYKHRLTAPDSGVQVAIIPFAKVPTAKKGVGNGKGEGGLVLPISFAIAGPVTMTFGPELDVLADADGRSRHAGVVQLVSVSGVVAARLTLLGELWANWNFDPNGTSKQVSADIGAAYAATNRLQFDAGANFGLNHNTSGLDLYAGASIRF